MRKNRTPRVRRDPEEHYDHIYEDMPDCPLVSRIIDHPRKLVIHNLCANPWMATVEEINWERTCYEDEVYS